MKTRRFGRTGHMSTVAIFGAAAFWEVTQAEADASMERVIAAGVNHIDVAPSYGVAEARLGPWMAKERKRFFLGCKTMERTKAGAAAELRRSLERLRVDSFDLCQIHAVTRLAELGHLLVRQPEVTAFVELKRSSIERFGIDTLLTLVRRSLKPALAQCILISYSLEALLAARRQGWSRIGAVIDQWDEHGQELIAKISPQFLFCDVDGLPREGQLQIDGTKLVIFEVADPRVALALAARGVDFIETFAVGEMLQELSRHAASP